MKVALLDTFQKDQLNFWTAFFRDLELEVVTARASDPDTLELGRQTLPGEPRHLQFAVGRLQDLHDQGATVLVPRIAEAVLENVNSDPWLTDFPLVVNHRLSLPQPEQFPTYGEEEIQRAALTLGTQLSRNPQRARMAWDRHKTLLKPRRKDVAQEVAGYRSVAVIAPRYLLQQDVHVGALWETFKEYGLHPVLSSDLDRSDAINRASRTPQFKTATDIEQEMVGALNLLEGKGFIQGTVFLVPDRADQHLKFARFLMNKTRKPSLVLPLLDTPELADGAALRAFAERLGQYNQA